jgi:hypothetical protein
MAKTIWKGRLQMRDDLNVKIDLEAEDTLAVRLRALSVEGPRREIPAREALQRQTSAILEKVTYLEGGLALVEVDGVSEAVLIRSQKPVEGRFVQIVLRNGNSIRLEARGGAVHLSRENYEKLVALLTGLMG